MYQHVMSYLDLSRIQTYACARLAVGESPAEHNAGQMHTYIYRYVVHHLHHHFHHWGSDRHAF